MMQRIVLLFTVLITSAATSLAQNGFSRPTSDSIVIVKRMGGYQFYKNDRQMSMSKLQTMFQDNDQAYKEIKSARSAATASSILGYAGGFFIGWPLGTAMGGGKPMWGLAAVGAGLTAISIPLSINAKKKARSAVSKYNAGLTSGASALFKEVKLNFSNDGMGVVLKF
jgi:hypothetical protein